MSSCVGYRHIYATSIIAILSQYGWDWAATKIVIIATTKLMRYKED
jgi:hypothetical protein